MGQLTKEVTDFAFGLVTWHCLLYSQFIYYIEQRVWIPFYFYLHDYTGIITVHVICNIKGASIIRVQHSFFRYVIAHLFWTIASLFFIKKQLDGLSVEMEWDPHWSFTCLSHLLILIYVFK